MSHNGGSTFHPLYGIWRSMRIRCDLKSRREYKYYGGRGIKVCPEWANFWTFVFDIGKRPSNKHSVERIDNDGPYAPWNCRWATKHEQTRNTSSSRYITHDGLTLCLEDWATRLGIRSSTLARRLKLHPERAFLPKSAISSRTRLLTHDGVTLCMEDWAKRIGIDPATMHYRLKRHPDRAFVPKGCI